MKRRTLTKFGAAALTLAMLGTSGVAFAEEGGEQTYDFGGAEIKVFGNNWNRLNPESQDDNAVSLDNAKQVEEKYNVKFVYTEPDGYDGRNLSELIQTSMTSGEGAVNILDMEPDALMSLISNGYLVDLTDEIDQLKVGSLYTQAGTWQGRCYGMTFDNVGDTYAMVYSRDYLDEIGMDVTPTEKFMNGEWSYDDMKAYLTDMKAKLPEGVYPIGIHYYHWASMAGAANGGYVGVSSDGKLNIAEEAYLEALSFYRTLLDEGLAAPIEVEFDENNEQTVDNCPYGVDGMNNTYVITSQESWQFGGIEEKAGKWGVVMWPWGSEVTCDGDYTTLSDNYRTAQSYWSTCGILTDAEAQTGIPAITLMQIANDYYDLNSPSGAEARHAYYEAEQAGETPSVGYSAGDASRGFCTIEDMDIYDWAHGRVMYDWAKPCDNAGVTDIWAQAAHIIGNGEDARSVGDSYYQSGFQKAVDLGILSADGAEPATEEAATEEVTTEAAAE